MPQFLSFSFILQNTSPIFYLDKILRLQSMIKPCEYFFEMPGKYLSHDKYNYRREKTSEKKSTT